MSIKFEPLPKLPLPIDSLIVHYIVSTNLVPSHNRGMRFNNLEKTWKIRWEETTSMCCASTNLRNFTTHKNCGIAPSAGNTSPPLTPATARGEGGSSTTSTSCPASSPAGASMDLKSHAGYMCIQRMECNGIHVCINTIYIIYKPVVSTS